MILPVSKSSKRESLDKDTCRYWKKNCHALAKKLKEKINELLMTVPQGGIKRPFFFFFALPLNSKGKISLSIKGQPCSLFFIL